MSNYTAQRPVEYKDIDQSNIVFKPIIGSSQEVAMDSRADETLYHGTRGPGKTAVQLNFARQFIGVGYGAFMKIIMIDKHYKNFADVIAQAKKFFLPYGDCKFLGGTSEVKFVWNTGEEFLFRHMKDADDYQNIHGMEHPIILWNELTKHATSDLYDLVSSTNRSSFIPEIHTPKLPDGTYNTPDKKPLPEIPLKIFSTTNSSGPGRLWVKKRFIDVAPSGTLVKTVTKDVFNPRTQKYEDIVRTQIAIFGSFMENIYLSPKYIADLMEKTKNNKHLYNSWILGLWDKSSGGAFDDIFNSDIHIVNKFAIPSNWYTKRCFDWGNRHPFAVVWMAESNGEEVYMPDGTTKTFPKGSQIIFHEIYGGEDITTNVGLGKSPKEISAMILEEEMSMMLNEWISEPPDPGAADNQIGNVITSDRDTIKTEMENCGVSWTESDKSKGSRVWGLNLIRNMLKCAIEKEGAGIYFMRHCVNCIETIPNLPLDEDNPEDIDTSCNDHLYDATRYGIVEGSNRLATNIKFKPAY